MLRYAYFLQICFYTIISFAAIKVGFKWDAVFKSGPCKIFGIQPLKSLKEYGLLKALIFFPKVWKENFLEPQNQFHAIYLGEPGCKINSYKM